MTRHGTRSRDSLSPRARSLGAAPAADPTMREVLRNRGVDAPVTAGRQHSPELDKQIRVADCFTLRVLFYLVVHDSPEEFQWDRN